MPDKNERERREQLRDILRDKAEAEFNASLPMSRALFMALFDYLDTKMGVEGCDHTLRLTNHFLAETSVNNTPAVREWMADKGGYCDCEVLANVEELFEIK